MFRSRDSGFTALSQSDEEGDAEEHTSLTMEDDDPSLQPRHSRTLSSPPKAPGSSFKKSSAGVAMKSPSATATRSNSLPSPESGLSGMLPMTAATSSLHGSGLLRTMPALIMESISNRA